MYNEQCCTEVYVYQPGTVGMEGGSRKPKECHSSSVGAYCTCSYIHIDLNPVYMYIIIIRNCQRLEF